MPRCKYTYEDCPTYNQLQIDFRVSLCGEFEDMDLDYIPNCLSFVGLSFLGIEEILARNIVQNALLE